MKIYLDNYIFSKTKNGGIANYWYELIKNLNLINKDDLFYFEYNKDHENFFRKNLILNKEFKIPLKYNIFNNIQKIENKIEDKFIFHSSYYRRIKPNKNAIPITTVHDFTHDYFFNFYKKNAHNFLKYNSIRESKGIICISNSTYKDLKKFYTINSNQKHTIIYNGVSEDYFPITNFSNEQIDFIKKFDLNRDFILFIGSRINYKNFDFVANLLNSNSKLHLVIVGGGNFNQKETKLFKNDALKRVTHFHNLDNDKLNILYNLAKALIYPSSYEGFGIPIVEAMRAGCPVLGLNTPTNIEIAEKSIFLNEKLSITDFNKNLQLLNNKELVEERKNIGFDYSKKYCWKKCINETREFYKYLWEM